MAQARLALRFGAPFLIIVAVSAAVAVGAYEGMAPRTPPASPVAFVSPQALSPAVVVAHKPTLAEIVDLVLGERSREPATLVNGKFALGSDEARIANLLRKYTSNDNRANRIASALVKEGRQRNIGSSLLVGVLLTENPDLDPRAKSSAGARGLMQVMPFHSGKWGCASGDLFDIESNICHGVAILADNLKSSKTLPAALLGYNGCVRGTNTPDCWRYPTTVFRYARKDPPSRAFPPGTIPFSAPRQSRQMPAKRRFGQNSRNPVLPRGSLVN
ncbi:MAG: transglycosylase SLT domain-containing protein [Gemmatimonadaceae bacterium]